MRTHKEKDAEIRRLTDELQREREEHGKTRDALLAAIKAYPVPMPFPVYAPPIYSPPVYTPVIVEPRWIDPLNPSWPITCDGAAITTAADTFTVTGMGASGVRSTSSH